MMGEAYFRTVYDKDGNLLGVEYKDPKGEWQFAPVEKWPSVGEQLEQGIIDPRAYRYDETLEFVIRAGNSVQCIRHGGRLICFKR